MFKYFKSVSAQEGTVPSGFKDVGLPGGVGQLQGGLNSVSAFFVLLTNTIFVLGIALSLLFVIIGGIKIITSAGDEQKFSEGKSTVANAVIGFVIVVGYRIIANIVFGIIGIGTVESNLGS